MHLAVIIRTDQEEGLPTAAELREAGFAVSSALGPARGPDGAAAPPNRFGGGEADRAPERTGPPGRSLPERQRP
jgi:hypothetical protein